jgi:hypothetical protein
VDNQSGQTGQVMVGAFYDPGFTGMVSGTMADSFGNYTLPGLCDGTYYLGTYVDVNGDMQLDLASEANGYYGDMNGPFNVDVSGGGDSVIGMTISPLP